ncbi:sensor histidine kinase [Chenggangzhangella methanolivorans]|uniref:histidine kinase n=1 Tax=Chenggangzhangella methanolivorans TaxID=1437009 RepID=A0A9E6UMJ4_9HYPH|nr:GAF domain-containing protein [Chenggangzhangella methanolivorans]QZO01757.1 GAF domain-containing protein [Chenggangzhangella methanolivorans]
MIPPTSVTDEGRLAELEAYDILDTPPEPGFDEVVHIARVLCDAPVALVSFVAGNRQWFKAREGFEPCETDLDSSVCAHALVEPDLLIIPDLTKDPRTQANPLVTGDPHIRFYAGAPLRTRNGQTLGSLCVIDGAPRPEGLSDKQASALRNLAAQVMAQMDLRRALAERDALIAGRADADRRRHALLQLGDRLRDHSTPDAMIHAASEIVGVALNASRVGFGHLDADSRHIDIASDWTKEGVASVAGRHRFEDYGDLLPDILQGEALIIHDVRSDPRTAADPKPMERLSIRSLVNVPVRERGRTVAMFIVHDDEPRKWEPEVLAFLRNVADRLEVGVGRLRAESDQRVLNQELSHRMKNMMSMVQAIVTQTIKSETSRETMDAVLSRLMALATAHDVLLQEEWSAASIGTVVKSTLKTLCPVSRFDVAGEDLALGPRATLSLGLLLHELTTNAMKHGALSVEGGRVSLSWKLEPGDDQPELTMLWSESGGPEARQPTTRGFGSRLIRMGLVGTGGVELRYLPSGLKAEFRAPLNQVQQS